MSLEATRSIVHNIFIALTALLTAYVAAVNFGWLGESVQFFAVVAVSITVVASILAVRYRLDEKLLGVGGWRWNARLSLGLVALVLALIGGGYLALNMRQIALAAPFFNGTQRSMGVIFLVAVIIASWQHWGSALPILVIVSIIYFFFGNHIDIALLSHPSYTPNFILNYVTLNPDYGVFQFLEVLTDELYFLILFGAVLVGIGAVRLFIEIGNAVGKRVAGGAAFPAIIASGVLGAILAQAVASTTVIGRLTIPTMRNAGFSRSMAGAIETLAATSGQLMPPILGLAAFIMAALLNIPYITIALASFIPAVLYLVALVFTVVSYSGRHRLGSMSVEIDKKAIVRLLPGFVIPFAVVMVLLVHYVSPAVTGLVGIGLALAAWPLSGQYRLPVRDLLKGIGTGFELIVLLAILVLLVGPLAQSFQTTGLSNNFGIYLATVLPHTKFVLLLIAAAVGLLLGMGLPTPIAYLAAVLTMGTFLVGVAGIKPLLAHLFLFYFAVFSTITPPLAVGALAASKIAEVSFWRVGGQAMKVAVSLFILPFVFVYNPVLVSFPSISWLMIQVMILVALVQCCCTCAQFGYMFRDLYRLERVVLFLIGACGFVSLLQPDRILWLAFGLAAAVAIGFCALSARLRPAVGAA